MLPFFNLIFQGQPVSAVTCFQDFDTQLRMQVHIKKSLDSTSENDIRRVEPFTKFKRIASGSFRQLYSVLARLIAVHSVFLSSHSVKTELLSVYLYVFKLVRPDTIIARTSRPNSKG
ncbi:hypothetical protein EG68_01546 [Paragonimus skrjabini miyazakii]|uniref:Uncharacterized protein n=1 Tax=Paragonimus skrjabini miyazakii TaxID=59628 RepID=A0A8S9Z441_9TREM|nr:hypothetical protein EG68_01546 [Paragonimus skrjabini miyazakii]